MNLSGIFEAVKKLPEEVMNSVTPHIGGLRFFGGILQEDIEDIKLDDISKKDAVKIAFDYCRKELKNSDMTVSQKAKFLAGLPKLIYNSENSMRVLKEAALLVENPENTFPLNQEWAEFFFAYSKKTSDRDIQKILGRILADELENKDGENNDNSAEIVELRELSEEYFNRAVEKMRLS